MVAENINLSFVSKDLNKEGGGIQLFPFSNRTHELWKTHGWFKPRILRPKFQPKGPSELGIHKHLPADFVTTIFANVSDVK